MRLLVNATSYGEPPGGAGLRAAELFAALRTLEPEWEIEFLLAEDTPEALVPAGCGSRRLPVKASRPLERYLKLDLPEDGDVLLTDHYPLATIPTVITLHDRGGSVLRRQALRRGLKRAAAVVAVSETVREALWPEAIVIPNGFEPPPEIRPPPRTEPYLLFSDPGLPHKNAATARTTARAANLPLLEVGRGATWLSREEMTAHLAGATAVLCPSTEEGFGMVPLEAMALGRPVVLSDIPAHRESCPVGFFADPADAGAFQNALNHALRCDPARLQRGRDAARTLTWRSSAQRLLQTLRTVGSAPQLRPSS